ncbi:Ubiquinone biosynthesis O-methyltransferase, mitochondrial [subsurface metagenome]|nr:methyltransferase domain-containing protein [Clostridia bacterium]
MFLKEKSEKLKKKEYFHKLFSNRTNIDYWESVYNRQDFLGVCYRRRMYQALSWLGNSNLSENSKILDVGCGAGMIAKEVANRGYEIWGMDYSYNMIRKAKTICNVNMKFDTNFLQGDIESLPFKDSVFDMVLCLGVITYLKSEQKALQEMSRILKPGGTMILSILNKFSLAKCLDISVLVKRRLQRIAGNRIVSWQKRAEIEENRFVIKSYFIPSLRNALRTARFTELACTTVQYGPLTFFGRNIFPEGISINITTFLEKFSNVPVIRSLGNMCLFRLRKVGGK